MASLADSQQMPQLNVRLLGAVKFNPGSVDAPGWYQPKKVAALAYLLLARGSVHRGELAALLWPESDARRARRSLNQLLLEIRRDHGWNCISSNAAEYLLVDSSEIECDVVSLLHSARLGNHAGAVALYSGELMPGFLAAGASEYNDWLDSQRQLIRDTIADSLFELAGQARNPPEAVALLKRCCELRPYDEVLMRRLMSVLSDAGDRSQAIAVYERFRAVMKGQFGVVPDKATRELATKVSDDPSPSRPLVTPDVPTTQVARPRSRRPHVASYVAAALLVLCGGASYLLSSTLAADEHPYTAISIADFEALGPEAQIPARTLPDAIAAQLAVDTSFRVVRSNTRSSSSMQVVGSIAVDGDVYTGRVQVRDRDGHVLRSAIINSSIKLGIDSAAVRVATVIKREWYALNPRSPDGELLDVARQHIVAARVDLASMSGNAAQAELAHAQRKLDSVPASRRRFEWVALQADLLMQQGRMIKNADPAAASALFGRAAAVMRSEGSVPALELAAEYRSKQWMFDAGGTSVVKDSAHSELTHWLSQHPQSAALWLELSSLRFSQADFDGAFIAADKGRILDPVRANNPASSLMLFLAAFNARRDQAANAECDRIRHAFKHSWPAATCTALTVGWSGATYDFEDGAAPDLTADPPPLADAVRPRIVALAAAAYARTGRLELARRHLETVKPTADFDLAACRALAFAAIGNHAMAASLRDSIVAQPHGRRILQLYQRAFEDVVAQPAIADIS